MKVLTQLREWGITISLRKTVLCNRTKFLGYVCEDGKMMIESDRVAVIQSLPKPKIGVNWTNYVGCSNFLSKFIADYCEIMADCLSFVAKKVIFSGESLRTWLLDHLIAAFVIQCIIKVQIKSSFVIHYDVSTRAFASILSQYDKDSNLHPLYPFSKVTPENEYV